MIEIRINIKSFFKKIKRIIWNRHLLIWYYKLWTPKDEFHKSLNIDLEAVTGMNNKQIKKYWNYLTKRRTKAHRKDLGLSETELQNFREETMKDLGLKNPEDLFEKIGETLNKAKNNT